MSNPYVGEIRMFAGSFAPAGWAFCDGQLMPISENEVLFQLIGTTYGGDGEETFALPNLQSRAPVHMGTSTASGATYQIGEMAGTEQVTLTTQQIPNHTHPIPARGAIGTAPTPAAAFPAASKTEYLYAPGASPVVAMKSDALQPIGGSQPHENMQPFIVISFIISLFGLFPSQT